jgi:hypothetical protein
MPSVFLRSDKKMIEMAEKLIKKGFTDIPAVHLWAAEQKGYNMKRFAMIFQKLLELNKEIDDDLAWRPTSEDSVVGQREGENIVGREYRKLLEKYEDSPYFAAPDLDDKLTKIAQVYVDSGFVDIPEEEYGFLIQSGINMKRLSILMRILLENKVEAEKAAAKKAAAKKAAAEKASGAGSSSFGTPRYITVNGRKRRLYKGLYGGIYYKNTYGTKIYLKSKMKMKKNKNKIIKSADGISVTGWKNILDFYEKSNHKITWVHSPTRVLKMIKIGDMIEFTVKTDDSGDMYNNYLEIIVSPDDDGNYPVSIDGKKYLIAGNVEDAKNTFSYVHGAPDVFNRGRNWYVYKFKTRINLTEV